MPDTPQSLLERLQEHPNDQESWRQLVELYTPFLLHWARRLGAEVQDAEDVSQDVLSIVVKKLPQFKHTAEKGAFRKWLRTTLAHCLSNRRRKNCPVATGDSDFEAQLRQLESPNSDLSALWEQEHDEWIAGRLVQMARAFCTDEQWEIFRRLQLEGEDVATVAAALGKTPGAVMTSKSRTLKQLRELARGLLD